MRVFTTLSAVWFPPGRTAGSSSAWYTQGRAPESGLNVWTASLGPGSNITRPPGCVCCVLCVFCLCVCWRWGGVGGEGHPRKPQPVIVTARKSNRIEIIKLAATLSGNVLAVDLCCKNACWYKPLLFLHGLVQRIRLKNVWVLWYALFTHWNWLRCILVNTLEKINKLQ